MDLGKLSEDLKSICFDIFRIIIAVVLLENVFNGNNCGTCGENESVVSIVWAWILAIGFLLIGLIISFFTKKKQEENKEV